MVMSKKRDDMYWITTGLMRNDARLLPIKGLDNPKEDDVLFTVKAPDAFHQFSLQLILDWLQEYHDLLVAAEEQDHDR